MKLPKITIITATYNSAKTIADSIESVLNQHYDNMEYIIIDGESRDNTIEIVQSYEPLFHGNLKWISEKDLGIYDAWNKGVRMSTGDWIGFIGGDDVLCDKALHMYCKEINNNPDVNYISSFVELVRNDMSPIKVIGRPWSEKILVNNVIAHVGSLHRKSLFEKYGLYSLDYDISSDYDLLLKCYDGIVAGFSPYVTAKMRCNGVSNSLGHKALKETLKIKLIHRQRNIALCYFDFYYSLIKYKLRGIFEKY